MKKVILCASILTILFYSSESYTQEGVRPIQSNYKLPGCNKKKRQYAMFNGHACISKHGFGVLHVSYDCKTVHAVKDRRGRYNYCFNSYSKTSVDWKVYYGDDDRILQKTLDLYHMNLNK
jgi:hypothetical protein